MKKWEKPQLVVLARSRPEECVLLACKSDTEPLSENVCWTVNALNPNGVGIDCIPFVPVATIVNS